jgi:hypothetical protein
MLHEVDLRRFLVSWPHKVWSWQSPLLQFTFFILDLFENCNQAQKCCIANIVFQLSLGGWKVILRGFKTYKDQALPQPLLQMGMARSY